MKLYKNMTLALPSEIAERLERIASLAGKSKRSVIIESITQYLTVLEIESYATQSNNIIADQPKSVQIVSNDIESNDIESNHAKLLREYQEFQNKKTGTSTTHQLQANNYELQDPDEDEEEE